MFYVWLSFNLFPSYKTEYTDYNNKCRGLNAVTINNNKNYTFRIGL